MFKPPYANTRTVLKPIVPVDEDGNIGIGMSMDSTTRRSGLIILEQNGLLEASKPDGKDFSVFIMRRGDDEEKRRVHVIDRPVPSLSVQRSADGIITPTEIEAEITDEEGFMEFWEKVAFCAKQETSIESTVPL
jgi:hypothetical protein